MKRDRRTKGRTYRRTDTQTRKHNAHKWGIKTNKIRIEPRYPGLVYININVNLIYIYISNILLTIQ